LFFTKAREGLWQVPTKGGVPTQVSGFEHSRFGRLWTVAACGIYFVDIAADRSKLNFYDFETRRIAPIVDLSAEAFIGYPSLSSSPREDAILFASSDEVRSDLMTIRAK
jgi:hypothetical protein